VAHDRSVSHGAQGSNRGVAFNYAARFLSVWTRQGGQWRNLAYQGVEIDLPR
jgi:hypothetical protein